MVYANMPLTIDELRTNIDRERARGGQEKETEFHK